MSNWLGLPALASAHGGQIDSMIGWVHVFMLILFVGWGGFFAYCLVRFRRSRNPVANYTGVKSHTSSYLEVGVAVVEAILLFGFAIPLWAARVDAIPPESQALVVQITGEQFAWNAHYAGPDGVFGRTDIKLLDLWIAAGASATLPRDAIAGAPPIAGPEPPSAPDYRPQLQQIASLEAALGIQLVPRSQVPTDGLILRTASFPARANDAAIARLAPLRPFIVDAELARSAITDAALNSLASFANLRRLDLSYTAVTPDGLRALAPLKRLETLNLTGTAANAAAVAGLRSNPALKHVYVFQTPAAD